jgi:hypothetical protein
VSVALLAASPLAARATGLDGAGQRMIVPLVFTGGDRESTVTLANPHVQPASLSIVYVGAEGTRHAASVDGEIGCPDLTVPARHSVSRRLRDLCPGIHEADLENFGYLVVTVRIDPPAVGRLFVESVVDGRAGIASGITGQPVGAYNAAPASPATLGLEVGGLRTRAAGGERPVCFVASLDEKKAVDLDLRDASGARLGSTLSMGLDARRMERIDLQSKFGLPPQDRDELRLTAASSLRASRSRTSPRDHPTPGTPRGSIRPPSRPRRGPARTASSIPGDTPRSAGPATSRSPSAATSAPTTR